MMTNYQAELERLLKQEQDLQFTTFTNDTAFEIGTRIIQKAQQEQKAIAVTIVRNGELLFHTKMNGTTADNDMWIKRKMAVVHHFEHSSYYMHVKFKAEGGSVEAACLDPKDYAAEGGSFPLIIKNVGVVGTISASGLPGDQDHHMIVSVLEAYLGEQ